MQTAFTRGQRCRSHSLQRGFQDTDGARLPSAKRERASTSLAPPCRASYPRHQGGVAGRALSSPGSPHCTGQLLLGVKSCNSFKDGPFHRSDLSGGEVVVLCQGWASRHSCARRAREQTLKIPQGVQREVGVPPRAPPGLLLTLRVVDGHAILLSRGDLSLAS